MPGTRFRFGLFEFNPDPNELRREGTLLRLQAQPAQVLACPLEHAGEVVSREQLRRLLWQNGTFVDFERGLNFCVAQVRGVLKDGAISPRFIRTIPKRGDQFIAPVERIANSQNPERIAPPARHFWYSARSPLARTVLVSISALTLFTVGYWSRNLTIATRNPIVAVARFDNETGDPKFTRVADSLSDDLVADLTSASNGQFRVIGNARILRVPREQRDLTNIATSLNASYVALGQMQISGSRTRILAHLIHLPEQTHVWSRAWIVIPF